jgi:hypothetical protein
VRENALHTATTNLGNGSGVQKCKFGLSFAKLFSGDIDFAKPRLIFQKRIFGFGFRPAGGVWGGMRGGFFFGFLAGGLWKTKSKNGKIFL